MLDNDGEIPEVNLNALVACRHSDVAVALATGRRWSTTQRLLDRLQLRPWIDFAIMNNGMLIHDLRQEKVIDQTQFPISLAHQITEELASLKMDPILLSHSTPKNPSDVWYREISLLNQDFVQKNHSFASHWSTFEEFQSLSIVEILLVGYYEDLQKAETWLTPFPVETALIRNSFYREWMLEITPKGRNKLSGAKFLQGHLGLSENQTMAIGDSANDLPLLKAAGHRVAMEEAPESLKAIANRITGSNHIGGMGLAVMDWL